MVTRLRENELEEAYIKQKTPFDSDIKDLIKELHDLKMFRVNMKNNLKNLEDTITRFRERLDQLKNEADKTKK